MTGPDRDAHDMESGKRISTTLPPVIAAAIDKVASEERRCRADMTRLLIEAGLQLWLRRGHHLSRRGTVARKNRSGEPGQLLMFPTAVERDH